MTPCFAAVISNRIAYSVLYPLHPPSTQKTVSLLVPYGLGINQSPNPCIICALSFSSSFYYVQIWNA